MLIITTHDQFLSDYNLYGILFPNPMLLVTWQYRASLTSTKYIVMVVV